MCSYETGHLTNYSWFSLLQNEILNKREFGAWNDSRRVESGAFLPRFRKKKRKGGVFLRIRIQHVFIEIRGLFPSKIMHLSVMYVWIFVCVFLQLIITTAIWEYLKYNG